MCNPEPEGVLRSVNIFIDLLIFCHNFLLFQVFPESVDVLDENLKLPAAIAILFAMILHSILKIFGRYYSNLNIS